MKKLLIVEPNSEIRRVITTKAAASLSLDSVPALDAATAALQRDPYDVVIVGAQNGWREAPELQSFVHEVAQKFPQTCALVLAEGSEPTDFADGSGHYLWIQGSVDDGAVCDQMFRYLASHPSERVENVVGFDVPVPEVQVPLDVEGIIAVSMPMREVIQQVLEAAAVDAPVLITGETGTGKDLVAAAIHKRSSRKARNYVPVNMGALPAELIASELFGHEKGAFTGAADLHLGMFEQARGGSVFLDEITTMDERTQVALLRVLETQTIRRVGGNKDLRINARIIAATNESIEDLVKSRRFREDLFYRLDVFRIHLPPLRERPGGVSILTNHFISRFATLYKKNIRVVPSEVYALLRSYAWPGNVRELKNVIQRAVVKAKGAELTVDLLPSRIRETSGSTEKTQREVQLIHLGMTLEEVEKEFVTMTLTSLRGNKAKAATALGISRRTLYDKLKKYGLL